MYNNMLHPKNGKKEAGFFFFLVSLQKIHKEDHVFVFLEEKNKRPRRMIAMEYGQNTAEHDIGNLPAQTWN